MPRSTALKLGAARRSFVALTMAIACGVGLAATAVGQTSGVSGSNVGPSGGVSPKAGGNATFYSLTQAARVQSYTAVQLRRFFDSAAGGPGNVTTVREELRVRANGTGEPDFELQFLGVEGEPQGSPAWLKWSQSYDDYGHLFVGHGSFRVRDLGRARANYTLHHFGTTTRIGRAVQRVVVYPRTFDKAIWLLEVDRQTQLPLYVAEYDAHMRMLSEVETIAWQPGAVITSPATNTAVTTVVMASFHAARSAMTFPSNVFEPSDATAEYGLDRVELRTSALNNRQSLVLTYTDGIDAFFLLETPNGDPFRGLPVRDKRDPSHTIARYRDPAMSVLLFWNDGVSFQVAGRGALRRLDDFAREIYRQSIAGG